MTSKLRAVLILAALSLVAAWTASAQAQLPSLSIDDVEQAEGSSWTPDIKYEETPFPFTVTLSAPSTNWVTVQYRTTPYQGNKDYIDVSVHTLTFAPGETEKTITVSVVADFTDEPTETFNVELSNAANATIARGIGIGTILNDDAPPTSSDLILTMIPPKSTIHLGETAKVTFQITNNGPEDVSGVYFAISHGNQNLGYAGEASQGRGCADSRGLFDSTGCALNTIASGATATVTLTVYYLPLPCPELEELTLLPAAYVSSPVNNDPDRANDTFRQIRASEWVDVQPNVRPAMLDLTVGSTQTLSVEVSQSYGGANETIDVSADDNCISVPPTVVTTAKYPYTATIPVTAILPRCTAHVIFKRDFCSPTYSVPVTTHTVSVPVGITFDPSSPSVTAGQTIHVRVNASPMSEPATFSVGGLTRTIDVPSSVVIDPIDGGDIAIKGLIGGAFSVIVSAPPSLGSSSSTLSGQVLDAPPPPPSSGLTDVHPNSGSTNGGTLVRLSGLGFTPDCWAFFDSVAAHNVIFEGTTSLVAATPRHGAGTVGIALRCSGSADSLLNNAFTYVAGDDPAPLITSVDPFSAAPGQQVTIHGLHFRTSDSIMFGSAAATSVSSAPDAHLALVPSLPPVTVSVTVTDILGRLSTTGPIFTVLDNTPQITRISPTSLPAGAELTIDGSGFRAPYVFTIGGQTARIVTLSFNRAVVRVPALAPGSYELRVVNATGQIVANGGSLTVMPLGIVIASVEPSCARADGGSVLHIAGTGFSSGATVTIGDAFATNVGVIDASHIIATVPPLPPGRATVVVRNQNGESATATNAVAAYSPFDPDGCPVSYKTRAVHH